jgi:EpsI family protein
MSLAPASMTGSATAEHSVRNGLAKYVWLTVALVALFQGGAVAIERWLIPTIVRLPRHKLSELPLAIGRWTAKELPLDKSTFAAVGAADQSDRLYRSPTGDAIFIHRGAWTSQDDWTPHLPEVCYTSNGWTLSQTRVVSLPNHADAQLVIQNYQQSTQRTVVAYWYQIGDRTYTDRDGGRKLRRVQIGRRENPPLLKPLLQMDDTDQVEKRILEIASSIYEFNCEL